MMKRAGIYQLILIFSFISLMVNCAEAQDPKDRQYWFFGNYAGISFNSNPPSGVTGSALFSWEGSSSASDANGNLLFYSEGVNVWNRFHNVMQNGSGLSGGTSSTQACLVVPYPGDTSKYYLFTSSPQENSGGGGYRYSLIDMALDSGRGGIVSSVKDVFLYGPSSEKLAGVLHQNATDYWVITRAKGGSTFQSYLVTASGINTTPVTSTGSFTLTNVGDVVGAMCISPDGRTVAVIYYNSRIMEILDFNSSTGVLSNSRIISSFPGAVSSASPYGAAFSPNSRFLYVTRLYHNVMYQIDVTQPTAAAMESTMQAITYSIGSGGCAGAALSPEGELYLCRINQGYVSKITNPDTLAPYCNFVNAAVSFSGSQTCRLGLPNFVARQIRNRFANTGRCAGDTIYYYPYLLSAPDSFFWDFGDPSSGTANSSKLEKPFHIYDTSGAYPVKLVIYYGNKTDTVSRLVSIYSPRVFSLGSDLAICKGSTVQLSTYTSPLTHTFLWNTNATTPSIQVSTGGTYWVRVNNGNCLSYDTVVVKADTPMFKVNLGPDTFLCSPQAMLLDAGYDSSSYVWNTGDTTRSKTISAAGLYKVTVTRPGYVCKVSDSIQVDLHQQPVFTLGPDKKLCFTDTVTVDLRNKNYTHISWQDNSSDSLYKITQGGMYIARVSDNGFCYSSDTLEVLKDTIPFKVNLGSDTVLCGPGVLLLDAGHPGASYQWSTGTAAQSILTNAAGTYSVTVSRPGYSCPASDTMIIQKFEPPVVSLGADTHLCYGKTMQLDLRNKGYKNILWQDMSKDSLYTITKTGLYHSVVTDNGYCFNSDTVFVRIDSATFIVNLGPDTFRCAGETKLLDAGYTDATYLWHDNTTNRTYSAKQSNIYWVRVTRPGFLCPVSDTVQIAFYPQPYLDLGPDKTICKGDSVVFDLRNKGFYSVQWQDGSKDSLYQAKTTGIYSAFVTDKICYASDTFQLTVHSLPSPGLQAAYSICEGDSLVVNFPSAITAVTWGDGSTAYPRTIKTAGTYPVSYSDNLCTEKDTIELAILYSPQFNFPEDTAMCPGEQITLSPGVTNAGYTWHDGSTAPTFTTGEWGIYSVKVKNSCGEKTDTTEVIDCRCELYVPTAFTPDHNQLNDGFKPGGCTPAHYRLQVYNRWGQLVFETRDYNQAWMGDYNRQPVPAGVYIWVLEYASTKKATGANKSLKGIVTLMR